MGKARTAVVVAVAVLAAGLLSAQAVHVREKYGQWGLTAPQTPARIPARGRDYDRSTLSVRRSLPDGLEPEGTTDGGGRIFVPAGLRRHEVPLVIYVQDDDGAVWTYGLVGGP